MGISLGSIFKGIKRATDVKGVGNLLDIGLVAAPFIPGVNTALAGALGGLTKAAQGSNSSDVLDYVQAGLGILGTLQRPKTPKAIRDAGGAYEGYSPLNRQAIEGQIPVLKALQRAALAYNPRSETDAAVRQAEASGARVLQQANLKTLQRFSNAGGLPGMDTAYLVNRQMDINNVMHPVQRYVAEQRANETANRIRTLQAALGAGNSILGQGLPQRAAGIASLAPESDPGPSYALLADAIQSILDKRRPTSGLPTSYYQDPYGSPYA